MGSGGDITKITTAVKLVSTDIRTVQSQLRDAKLLETGHRQYGASGTEAQAPCGSGMGNEGKAGNSESHSGTGQ